MWTGKDETSRITSGKNIQLTKAEKSTFKISPRSIQLKYKNNYVLKIYI